VAVDSEGSVFADTYWGGPVTKYTAAEFAEPSATGSVVDGSGRTLAVDPVGDGVYVDEEGQVSQYGAHGEPLSEPTSVFASAGPNAISGSFGIAVNGSTGEVYVSDGRGRVSVFGPLVIVPDVATGSPSSVTTTTTTLHGTVDPDEIPVTGCQFEYGADASYGWSVPCAGDPGSGKEPVEVTANVTGLEPNRTYHYRLVAGNANGPSYGSDQSFLTPSPPLLEHERAASVSATNVELAVKIDSMGFDTTYHFEYGPSASYGASVPVPDKDIGAAGGYVDVSQLLPNLEAGVTYHYRVVATNANGTTDGPDRTLTTFAAPPAPALASDTCPNAEVRSEQASSFLADCRAYEMVSPVEKEGGDVSTSPTEEQISPDGERVKFISMTAFGGALGSESQGAEYISQRAPDGWSTTSINPEQSSSKSLVSLFDTPRYEYLTPDLSKGVFYGVSPVTPGHPNVSQVPNLYLRNDLLSGSPGVMNC
jgi:hypothetical protein